MTRAEDKLPDAPRCGNCGLFMGVEAEKERLVVYGCCGRTVVRFKPEFVEPDPR